MMHLESPLTYQQQADLLQSSGLVIADRNYAIGLLKKIGFYRLDTFGLPFQSQEGRYDGKTTIEDIERLHNMVVPCSARDGTLQ